jgi:hypothetical protein
MPDPEIDLDDILVTIAHNFGDLEVPLRSWIEKGPGPRKHLQLIAARSASTGKPLPLEVVPMQYINSAEARSLVAEGKLPAPWSHIQD